MSALVERILAARDAAKRHRDGPLLSVMADAANVIVGQEALLKAAEARVAVLEGALTDTSASLAAAISLLERSPKTAAPSDRMFDQMLQDYRASLGRARAQQEIKTDD